MASLTKAFIAMATAQNVAAGTPTAATNTVPFSTGFEIGIAGTITNGTTGPSVGCTVQLQGSVDSGTTYYILDQAVGQVGNSAVTPFAFNDIPSGWPLLRLLATGNTVQAVTLNAVAAYASSFA